MLNILYVDLKSNLIELTKYNNNSYFKKGRLGPARGSRPKRLR